MPFESVEEYISSADNIYDWRLTDKETRSYRLECEFGHVSEMSADKIMRNIEENHLCFKCDKCVSHDPLDSYAFLFRSCLPLIFLLFVGFLAVYKN